MATKKVWVSFPLITWRETSDASVVAFLKGGLKKELEVETAAFVTKWLMDKQIPFSVDFDSSTLDRNLVMQTLPRPLQKSLGNPAGAPSVPQTEPPPPVETSAA